MAKMVTPILLFLIAYAANTLAAYAPLAAPCPKTPLVRPANGLSDKETSWRVARKVVADKALIAWLKKTNSCFGTDNLPTIALTTSGGGYRSLLVGAGVVQGLDSRDSQVSTSGLYQALTYHAGLSGGGWLLSSLAGNNYPTVTSLRDKLWEKAFMNSLLAPEFLLAAGPYLEIVDDILDKQLAGFDTTLTDPWGRLLSYQLLQGMNGGVSTTLSSITGLSNFTSHFAPFPIITALGVKTWLGECNPGPNATTYEFNPFEFGSWDSDVSAFTQTHYLGTTLQNGKPTGLCTQNYDNLGYVLGTSSNLFNELCANVPIPQNSSTNLFSTLAQIVNYAHQLSTSDEYATYRNPFYHYESATGVRNSANDIQAQSSLSLVDGGLALQNNPIFPLLQPARNVSVILVNDNSADSNNFPNGSEILTTYVQSFNHGLTRMPVIPEVDTFISKGFDKKAAFFGCNDTSKITIIWLPNYNFTFESNVPTAQLVYPEKETNEMIANGVQVATQGGNEGWGTCLGCGLMMKTGQELPGECNACFEEYCYFGS